LVRKSLGGNPIRIQVPDGLPKRRRKMEENILEDFKYGIIDVSFKHREEIAIRKGQKYKWGCC